MVLKTLKKEKGGNIVNDLKVLVGYKMAGSNNFMFPAVLVNVYLRSSITV